MATNKNIDYGTCIIHCRKCTDGEFVYRAWRGRYDGYLTPPISKADLTERMWPNNGVDRFDRAEGAGSSGIGLGRNELFYPWHRGDEVSVCQTCQSKHQTTELVDYCLRMSGAHDYGDDT